MRINNVVIGLLLVALLGCSSEKETPNGMKFSLLDKGDGVLARPGEWLVYDFVFVDSNDSTWANSYERGIPQPQRCQDSSAIISEDGITQMLRMLSAGDSAKVVFGIKDFYSKYMNAPIPPTMDSTLELSLTIKVHKVLDQAGYMAFEQEMMAKQEEIMRKQAEKQLKIDSALIDEYLAEKNIQAQTTESGIRYVITSPGTGVNAESGQTVKVNYSGYLLNGEYFDSSVESVAKEKGVYNPMRAPYEPYAVTIDQTQVIAGWHEALKLLSEGGKGTFYIPSTLGYGPRRRSEVIVENSILVFDLEIVDVE